METAAKWDLDILVVFLVALRLWGGPLWWRMGDVPPQEGHGVGQLRRTPYTSIDTKKTFFMQLNKVNILFPRQPGLENCLICILLSKLQNRKCGIGILWYEDSILKIKKMCKIGVVWPRHFLLSSLVPNLLASTACGTVILILIGITSTADFATRFWKWIISEHMSVHDSDRPMEKCGTCGKEFFYERVFEKAHDVSRRKQAAREI